MWRWLALALAIAFPAIPLTVAATAGGLATQAITAVSQEAAKTEASPRRGAVGASRFAHRDIPDRYLRLYQKAGNGETWKTRDGHRYPAWAVLAGIGKVETNHGRLPLPGVRSGLNRYRDKRGRWRSCCAGPMQFNLVNGPPSTWDTYGRGNVYDPADAIPAARRLLLDNGARSNLDNAIHAYNHSWSYVATVKGHARRYQKG